MAIQRLYGKRIFKSQQSTTNLIDRRVCSTADETHQLKPNAQTLHIVAGSAWLSYQGEDHVLRAGDELPLVKDRFAALISALGDTPLVYEVIEAA